MFLPTTTTTSCLVSSQGEVEFYGIRNIKIFAREIVASKRSKLKVITPDQIQEFEDTHKELNLMGMERTARKDKMERLDPKVGECRLSRSVQRACATNLRELISSQTKRIYAYIGLKETKGVNMYYSAHLTLRA